MYFSFPGRPRRRRGRAAAEPPGGILLAAARERLDLVYVVVVKRRGRVLSSLVGADDRVDREPVGVRVRGVAE
jgi:hypothetical protein